MLKFKTSCAVGLSLFRYFEVGLRVCDIVVKKFTFAISSPDEFLYLQLVGRFLQQQRRFVLIPGHILGQLVHVLGHVLQETPQIPSNTSTHTRTHTRRQTTLPAAIGTSYFYTQTNRECGIP